jgi:hypothetical protein
MISKVRYSKFPVRWWVRIRFSGFVSRVRFGTVPPSHSPYRLKLPKVRSEPKKFNCFQFELWTNSSLTWSNSSSTLQLELRKS